MTEYEQVRAYLCLVGKGQVQEVRCTQHACQWPPLDVVMRYCGAAAAGTRKPNSGRRIRPNGKPPPPRSWMLLLLSRAHTAQAATPRAPSDVSTRRLLPVSGRGSTCPRGAPQEYIERSKFTKHTATSRQRSDEPRATHRDEEHAQPVVDEEAAPQDEECEHAGKQHQRASQHLVGGGVLLLAGGREVGERRRRIRIRSVDMPANSTSVPCSI